MNQTFKTLIITSCVALLCFQHATAQVEDKDGLYIAMQAPGLVLANGYDAKTKTTKFAAKNFWWGIPLTWRKCDWLIEASGAYAEGIMLHTMVGRAINITADTWIELMAGYANYLVYTSDRQLLPKGLYSIPAITGRLQLGIFYIQSTYNFLTKDEASLLLTVGIRGLADSQ